MKSVYRDVQHGRISVGRTDSLGSLGRGSRRALTAPGTAAWRCHASAVAPTTLGLMGRRTGQARRGASGWRTPHGETPYSPDSLLRALTANPFDVDHPRHQGHSDEVPVPDTPTTRAVTFLLAILLGLAVAISTASLRESAAGQDSPRAALTQRVLESRAHADDLAAEQKSKEETLTALQGSVLAADDPDATQRVDVYESAGGTAALRGPGVQVTIDDSVPLPPEPGMKDGAVNRVSDRDLQVAVNGLWAAGAEGIAINGVRLTSTSAIRTAGSAILVDFRPLSPPYVLSAIGPSDDLENAPVTGETGEYLAKISSRFGIRVRAEAVEQITLPSRPASALREATRPEENRPGVPAGGGGPSDDGGEED